MLVERKIKTVLAGAVVVSQGLSLPMLAQGESFSKTFQITGTEGGAYAIRATVRSVPGAQVPPVAYKKGVSDLIFAALKFPLPYTKDGVISIEDQVSKRFSYQQKAMLAKLLGLAGPDAVQAEAFATLSPKKRFLLRMFLQFQQDRIIANFEQRLQADQYLARQLGGNGRRDLLWLIRDIIVGAASVAAIANASNGKPSDTTGTGVNVSAGVQISAGAVPLGPEEIATQLKALMGDKLTPEASARIMEVLQESTDKASQKGVSEDIDRFAKLEEKASVIAAVPKKDAGKSTEPEKDESFSIDADDYEAWLQVSDEVGKEDTATKGQFLQMAVEAAGRVGSSSHSSPEQKAKAREFALKLSTKFHDLKTLMQEQGQNQTSDVDHNIEKCLRIHSGKDFYA